MFWFFFFILSLQAASTVYDNANDANFDDFGIYSLFNEQLQVETVEEPPYDTSLLWKAKRIKKAVHFAEPSPDSVTEICRLQKKKEQAQNIEPLPRITKEWIETELIPQFQSGQMISKALIKKIVEEATIEFRYEKTIEDVKVPKGGRVIVVGDIHGQFESTLTIFEDFGYPSQDLHYIFNGDIVDRGPKSLECLLMIFAYKAAFPSNFYVTRGNHESRSVCKDTFFEECQSRLLDYPEAFDDFQDAFDTLPYGHIVRNHFFVTHGGLCPGIVLSELRVLFRPYFSYKNEYALYSMLWNDPGNPADPEESFNKHGLAPSPRGDICRRFHPYVTFDFLKRNNLQMLVRSHQAVHEGYRLCHDDRCLTIFSAPNYRLRGNLGAVLVITDDNHTIEQMQP